VLDGLEAGGDAAADAAGGRIVDDEIRVLGLEPFELLHQGIEFGVGDLRLAQDVIALFVIANEPAKFLDAFGRTHRSRERT
jgi:hypothetical protein